MIERSILVSESLDTNIAAMLVQRANKFKSRIILSAAEKTANVKSIMGILSLGLDNGNTIVIAADGEDASEAVSELGDLLSGTCT